jgi:hypothetical protein
VAIGVKATCLKARLRAGLTPVTAYTLVATLIDGH